MYLDDQIPPQIWRGREALQNDWTISGCGALP